MNVEVFFTACQEPVLLKFHYEFGLVQFVVRLYDNDEILKIKVKTQRIYSSFCSNDPHNNTAVFTPLLEDLTQQLAVENGVYVPSKNFGQFMQETRSNLNLAYGLRCSQYQKIVRFFGDFTVAFIPEGEWIFEELMKR